MKDSKDIKDKFNESILCLEIQLGAMRHMQRLYELFDRPDFPLFIGYAIPTGRWTWVNQSFADFLGKTKEEIYKVPWTTFIADQEKDEAIGLYMQKREAGEEYENEPTAYIGGDGKVHVLEWTTGETHPDDLEKQTLCVANRPKTYKKK